VARTRSHIRRHEDIGHRDYVQNVISARSEPLEKGRRASFAIARTQLGLDLLFTSTYFNGNLHITVVDLTMEEGIIAHINEASTRSSGEYQAVFLDKGYLNDANYNTIRACNFSHRRGECGEEVCKQWWFGKHDQRKSITQSNQTLADDRQSSQTLRDHVEGQAYLLCR
jgi:hypothetical protein